MTKRKLIKEFESVVGIILAQLIIEKLISMELDWVQGESDISPVNVINAEIYERMENKPKKVSRKK